VHPCTTMCPTAPNPASLPRWAPTLPRAPRPRTSPPCLGSLRCCHVSHDSGSRLPAREGSGATTCHMAPNFTSLLGRALVLLHAHGSGSRLPAQGGGAPVLSCVTWLQTPPPCSGGLRCYHVYYGSRPCLPAREGSDAVMCPTTLKGPRALRIKKGLAGLPTRLGLRVFMARP
jgi:hypothetical protein